MAILDDARKEDVGGQGPYETLSRLERDAHREQAQAVECHPGIILTKHSVPVSIAIRGSQGLGSI